MEIHEETSGMWCVGLWLLGGKHEFRVFDSEAEAEVFMDAVLHDHLLNIVEIVMWEM